MTGSREEVRLVDRGTGTQIWADGLTLDSDNVVALDVKYVERPGGSSMYEGAARPPMQEHLMRGFDQEIARYGRILNCQDTPVGRLRLITNTDKAADYLGARARQLLGSDADIQVIVVKGE